jgi:hypothetical protein
VRLTDTSFNLELAPSRTSIGFTGSYFLGDYEGLAAAGNDFVAVWGMPDGSATNQESIFFRRINSVSGAHLTAASAGSNAGVERLTAAQVNALLPEAFARWQAASVDTSALAGIDVRIADLSGATLGLASGHTIYLDANAAGWGWFVDPTPQGDSEFTTPSNQGEQNRIDLLTVLGHEIGHLLGRGHEADGVMQETLDAGLRRTVGPSLAQNTGWLGAAQALDAWDAGAPWINHGFGSRNGKWR